MVCGMWALKYRQQLDKYTYMLNAGDGGQPRPRAYSDEDVLGRVGSIAHLWLIVLAAVVTKNTFIVRRW